MTRKMTILVLYYTRGVWPLRDTISTHLYCWREYSRHRVCYVNVAFGFPARLIRALEVDVVVMHTIYLSMRWSPQIFEQYTAMCADIAAMSCLKIAIPQDEFIHTEMLDRYLDETGVTHVLTCAEPRDWAAIYPRMTAKGAHFTTVLTGYLDERTVARIERLTGYGTARDIDIGYRAWRAQYWLGEHGMLKVWIADVFARAGGAAGLRMDISLKEADVLNGDDWFRFLLRCRTTLGVEGGASVCDHTGDIKSRVESYLSEHPQATFEETREACFPGKDGTFGLSCLSPRHLEACVTRTCQVLIRGQFNGVLAPDRHYIPLERDWSNLDQVLRRVSDPIAVEEIAERAYREVACNPDVGYRAFVNSIETRIIDAHGSTASGADAGLRAVGAGLWLALRDRFHWFFIGLEVRVTREPDGSWAAQCRRFLYAALLKWVLPRV